MPLTLYGYYKSSCTTRLRIALALKKIEHTTEYIDFFNKQHRGPAYAAINPNRSLPTLAVLPDPDGPASGAPPIYITQSVAALEYLEEAYPDAVPLLPADPGQRALVRSLVEIIVADLQPRQSALTLERLADEFGATQEQKVKWAYDWCVRELRAYETLVEAYSAGQGGNGKESTFSVGDAVTLADVALVPAITNAVERWGVDLERQFPTLARISARLNALPEVAASHWSQQPDAPKV